MTSPAAHRPVIFSDQGMVVSGHHKASEAGAAVLRAGGNAMDAAIATSAALCVALPHMNGIGGDCFALCYDAASRKVTAINGSGAAPREASAAAVRARGHAQMPQRGVLPISVPGLVHAWTTALSAFGSGRHAWQDLLQAGAKLAEDGVPVDQTLQDYFDSPDYRERAAASDGLRQVFGEPGLRAMGTRLPQPALAQTLRTLAAQGADAFYRGDIGRKLVQDLRAQGGLLAEQDLQAHQTRLVDAPSVAFHGRRLHFAPPNSQGLALGMLAGLWQAAARAGGDAALEPASYMRIKRIAFDLRDRFCVDSARGVPLPADLLQPRTFDRLLADAGNAHTEARRGGGDTSTFVVIDRWGNAVSWVQSLFEDFGSGVISPSTGIVLHNRLYLESLDEDSVHRLTPGMRPFHTLCPALLVGEGCEMAIATPGDHGQPQSIFQVLVNVFERGMNIQAAIESPRMRHDAGSTFMLESRAPAAWRDAVHVLGLELKDVGAWSRLMGGVNAIRRDAGGLLQGGADPRRSCYAVSA